jgi:hypothetical protein
MSLILATKGYEILRVDIDLEKLQPTIKHKCDVTAFCNFSLLFLMPRQPGKNAI